MGTITATAQPDKGRVRLDIDWTSNPSPRCWVYRIVGTAGTPTLIREGTPCVLSHNKATIYDTEGPLDQPTTYRTVVQLNDNGDMERGVEEWSSSPTTGGTVAQSTSYWSAGSASLQFTPNGTTSAPAVYSDLWSAAAGTSYTATAQVLSAASWHGGVGLGIAWYTSGGALISTTGTASNLWPATGSWETYTITGTAPSTTTQARIVLLLAGKPAATNVFYLDEAYASTPLGTVDSGTVVVDSAKGGWLKDPLHPATMVRIIDREELFSRSAQPGQAAGVGLVGVSRPSRPADAAVQEVPGSSLGVGLFAKRKAARFTVQVATASFADADAWKQLHAEGGPLLLQLPSRYGFDEQYVLPAQTDASGLGANLAMPVQVHQIQVTHTQMPPGPNEGVLGARYCDFRKGGSKTTYAAANSAGLTWQDGLKGNIS